jgi:hypothetical protein
MFQIKMNAGVDRNIFSHSFTIYRQLSTASYILIECNTTSLCTNSDTVLYGIGTMLARQQRRQVHLIAQARCKHIQLLLRRIGSDEAHHCCLQPSHAFGLSIGLLEHAQEQVAQREHCEDNAPNQPAATSSNTAQQSKRVSQFRQSAVATSGVSPLSRSVCTNTAQLQ